MNREADSIYDSLYEETMAEDREGGGVRVAPDTNDVQAVDLGTQETRKGKQHGEN